MRTRVPSGRSAPVTAMCASRIELRSASGTNDDAPQRAAQSLATARLPRDIAPAVRGRLQAGDSMSTYAERGAPPLGLLAGFTVGVVWVLLAIGALNSAFRGLGAGRPDWALGWGLVGTLLLGAGLSAIIGSWQHHRAASHH